MERKQDELREKERHLERDRKRKIGWKGGRKSEAESDKEGVRE